MITSGPRGPAFTAKRASGPARQALSGTAPGPGIEGIRSVLRKLRCLQLDPVNTVARSHLLVLWSRLGSFDTAALDTLRWDERWLFEYWAHMASIVLTEDYQIHHQMMRKYPVDARTRKLWCFLHRARCPGSTTMREWTPIPG